MLNMCKWTWACAVVIGLGPWCVDEPRGTARERPTAMHRHLRHAPNTTSNVSQYKWKLLLKVIHSCLIKLNEIAVFLLFFTDDVRHKARVHTTVLVPYQRKKVMKRCRDSRISSSCSYLRKLLGAITQLVVRDWNACGGGRREGPTTNSYKLIHLSGSRLATAAIRVEYFIIPSEHYSLGTGY